MQKFSNFNLSLVWKWVDQCRGKTTVEPIQIDVVPEVNNTGTKDHVSFTTGSVTLLIQSLVGAVVLKVC